MANVFNYINTDINKLTIDKPEKEGKIYYSNINCIGLDSLLAN